jgi:hypothetical protein
MGFATRCPQGLSLLRRRFENPVPESLCYGDLKSCLELCLDDMTETAVRAAIKPTCAPNISPRKVMIAGGYIFSRSSP